MIPSDLLVTVLINLVLFFTITIRSFSKSTPRKYEKSSKVESGILSITFIQYLLLFLSGTTNRFSLKELQEFRFVNMLITTPMVLYTYWDIASIEGYNGFAKNYIWFFWASLWMVGTRFLAEIFIERNKKLSFVLYLLSFIGQIYIFIGILDIVKFFYRIDQKEKANLGYFFLIGWWIYPLSYFFPLEGRFFLTSLGDIINKGMYNLVIQRIF